MASIKRSELEQLKANAAEAFDYCGRWVKVECELDEWKVRTWTAEQEIHDLKEQAERNNIELEKWKNYWYEEFRNWYVKHEEYEKLQETNTINNENYAQLKQAYSDLLGVKVVQLVNEVNNVPEELNPPACLKPGEALEWNAGTFYSTLDPLYRTMANGMAQAQTGLVMGPAQIFTKKAGFLKKHFGRITIGILLASLLGLGVISYRQNQVIQYQRAIIRRAITYVLQNCPPAGAVENNNLNSASK